MEREAQNMKPVLLALALVSAGAGLSAAAWGADGDPAKGHAFAKTFCARCHAVGQAGASPMAEAPPFRTLPTRWSPEHLAEALAEGIRVGHEAMPEFILEPQQIDDFVAYLQVLAPE